MAHSHPSPVSRFLGWLYERLYHELAWAYDPISWIVSGGRWRAWQRTALPHVTGPRVLEIGCGPGHLLRDLALGGYQVCGIDLSPAMWRRASGKNRGTDNLVGVLAADARALPFAAASFDSVLLTFPTPVVYARATWVEIARVLRPGGRLIIVLGARSNARWWPGPLELLLTRVSRQPTVEGEVASETIAGLTVQYLNLTTPNGTVDLIIADNTTRPELVSVPSSGLGVE